MKRLTKRNEKGIADFCGKYGDPPYPVVTQEILDKMADYEDLGFTPEEISYMANFFKEYTSAEIIADNMKTVAKLIEWSKWKEAEEEGRLVVLPCKVGDTVWFRTLAKNATVDMGVLPHKVSRIDPQIGVEEEFATTWIPAREFGKTVFLTKEEAEAALEKMKGETK